MKKRNIIPVTTLDGKADPNSETWQKDLEDKDRVHHLITESDLPNDSVRALQLHFGEGLTIKQTAKELGISYSRAKDLVNNTVRKLTWQNHIDGVMEKDRERRL